MTAQPMTLQLRVAEARELNPLIKTFRLRSADGGVLPGFAAGAHIRVRVELPDGSADWRHYSLINFSADAKATEAPTDYVIAVRKEAEGRGGSRFMHERLREGDTVTIEVPKNDFPLHTGPGGTVLLAGGIGVTPLASMATRRRAEGLPVRMHYAGRSRELMAFVPELQALLGDDLRLHADVEQGGPFDIGAMLDGIPAGDRLYVCGPKLMLDAVLAQTQARGWTHDRVHFELFTTPVVEEGDHAFEVELAQSGQRFTVPADQSILDCLIEHGCDPMFDCKRGECGVCATPVMEGEIDHRDYVLTAREKAEGNVMQICISRAKGQRLVLDM
ncbi:PDR/VanB family oxidoreductase [Variovorax sp. J31P179]|uniref:PDR/VanB family oxidoreductase n=1 Tax=Variovorax sp. J31P179 TaxID=3053508 RepID=UPI00257569BD|nr:PDR/VanB family oxidoreductase [Variovorax sp. J31P179]MDM0083084.1 PDR/VanB family oxidoreductase [Variovorax sp. J31P179]HET7836865.1 PDR/VanB family oxidoreductase [Variovorax sp.]